MITAGLTGGIGSGKSTVADFFREFSVPVFVADDEAKKLLLDTDVKKEVSALLGEGSYDSSGKPDRKFIASQVFGDSELLSRLNGIIHPRVRENFNRWKQGRTTAYILYEAAIIFETGSQAQFDYTILVTAPKNLRISRLKMRDKSTDEQIKSRMQSQWPDARKKKLADWVVENSNLVDTRRKVSHIHKHLLGLQSF